MATKRGVTLSQALEEHATVATIQAPMLSTFELWHPSFSEPIYVVNDDQDFEATKEADAARDPGGTVTFMAAFIQKEEPEESDEAAAPELALTLSNVSGPWAQAIRAARGSLDFWELIERVYMQNDPSGPARLPPLNLIVTSADLTEEVLTLRARFADPVNVSVPISTFRRAEYPGLVR